jgi:hypothetical protein
MLLLTADGREVYVTVYGHDPDDLCIDEAYYTDGPENIIVAAPDDVVAWLEHKYADRIQQHWIDKQMAAAESREDR